MVREYHKWFSPRLEREMEFLVFGHGGLPALAFPTSRGRFYELEDRGMIAALGDKIEGGQLQLYCMDAINHESWYNRRISPRRRISRHMQYEEYLLNEVVPLVRFKNSDERLMALGCSFGGYHAVNIALRHPDIFSGSLSLSGAFDLSSFLGGYYDLNCYFNFRKHGSRRRLHKERVAPPPDRPGRIVGYAKALVKAPSQRRNLFLLVRGTV